jgi:hypothetical protein
MEKNKLRKRDKVHKKSQLLEDVDLVLIREIKVFYSGNLLKNKTKKELRVPILKHKVLK